MTTTPANQRPRSVFEQFGDETARAAPSPPPPPNLPSAMFVATWGTIRLFASSFHTDNSRTQVVHDMSSGDVHPIQDRGLRARRVRVSLLFDDFSALLNQGAPLDSFRAFKAAVDSGARAVFTHPVEGSYLACVGEFTYEIDEHSAISNAVAEFIAEEEIPAIALSAPVMHLGEGTVIHAADAVDAELAPLGLLGRSPALDALPSLPPAARARLEFNARADISVNASVSVSLGASLTASVNASLNASLIADANVDGVATASGVASAGVGATTTAALSASASAAVGAEIAVGVFAGLTTDATAAVASWSEGTEGASPRQITNDVARITTNIETAIAVGGFELDLALWPAMRALIMLGDAVRSVASAATAEAASVFLMRVTAPTALLPLAARVYGGADAQDRARQIMRLNDIARPGWLDPGDYLLPARSPAQRSPF